MADSDNTTPLPGANAAALADLLQTCRGTLSYLEAQAVFHHSGEAAELWRRLSKVVPVIEALATTEDPAVAVAREYWAWYADPPKDAEGDIIPEVRGGITHRLFRVASTGICGLAAKVRILGEMMGEFTADSDPDQAEIFDPDRMIISVLRDVARLGYGECGGTTEARS
jgi:hypothetical protein